MNKKKFLNPFLEVINIKCDEIITSSGITRAKTVEEALFGENNHGVNVG